MAQRVATQADFAEFMIELDRPARVPLVAVSLPEGSTAALFPVEQFEHDIGAAADVWILEPRTTFWLTDRIGKRLSVFSGWVRVYPAGTAWRTDERRAPLLPARLNTKRWLQAVTDKVLDVAYADGYRPVPAARAEARVAVTVTGVFSATQALVRTDAGHEGLLRTHHLWAGVPADRLVTSGQRFEGTIAAGILPDFVPDRPAQDARARAIEFVGDGTVTLARVGRVEAHRAELLIHPEVAVTVEDSTRNLTVVLRPDEVVPVEVVPVDGELLASFSSDEPGPAMAILPDGPPWLVWDPPVEVPAPEPEPEPTTPPEPGSADLLVHGFEQEIEELEARISRLEEENRALRRAERERSRISIPRVYADPVEQLRLELHLAYLSRVPEGDRDRHKWPATYDVNPTFVSSMDDLVKAGGITREKIVEVSVEVLCGLAYGNRSRAVKEWLETRNGSPLVRADGAVAWRVRLQHKTNAARRLRYWQHPDGHIELDWVGVHDAEL